jgi:hypothetical protein
MPMNDSSESFPIECHHFRDGSPVQSARDNSIKFPVLGNVLILKEIRFIPVEIAVEFIGIV